MPNTPHHPTPSAEMLDPDIRFLLANERTLLAWVRTGLALQVGGLALAQLDPHRSGIYIGIVILLLGALCPWWDTFVIGPPMRQFGEVVCLKPVGALHFRSGCRLLLPQP